ncbi:hypothetical protein A3I36_04710 [Candidatus Giovannonibacteria bacterium RIFCSPLOWO2_02_FULL_45_28]|uniref:Uncharacterized protein n=2 Tax=Candidatus Giovannoniibacteriota TaxID=1752738 RepID=A0A1F5WC27_9BACT|nr:MAG: hypothetical protein UW15_C0020G0006 [Parcubacteria group bacterium GW2011_GWC1_44_10]KKT59414.1 MAG: hypothetical protein UW53_C0013G0015 [Candidatus Giovannonibacteria bacterium GW2011_GWA1_44_25]KKU29531.1 MAG: hypothetical protein UX43_C0010G0015 [Candidatus Giovannonibacteria bacterium GW2011_GWB1_46_20]OGF49110.1 MAG: hypothetical protein A2120_04835 [Candidatus Giovannonibacteria bacterium GWA2_45_15]OGF60548.1 MAG: hypothetical protein A2W40_02955 [Candidatus Giovannonibacteria 
MSIAELFKNIGGIIGQLIRILVAVATIVFFWGIIQYIVASGDEKKLQEGRQYIIYGIVGLFVIVAMWAIVNAVASTLFG